MSITERMGATVPGIKPNQAGSFPFYITRNMTYLLFKDRFLKGILLPFPFE
jgi:hypothetical protein